MSLLYAPVAPATMMHRSLYRVFPLTHAAAQSSLSYLDGYLSNPQSSGDFVMTLRYCRILVQLSEYLDKHQHVFIKLHREFEFKVVLDGNTYVTSSHLMEVMVRVLSLAKQCWQPLMTALRCHDGDMRPLVLLSDVDNMDDESVERLFVSIRNTIGLIAYCLNQIVPRAIHTVFLLNRHAPEMIPKMRMYYNTLRATGCWLAGVMRMRVYDRASTSERKNDDLMMSLKYLRECVMVVDSVNASSQDGVHVTTFMTILRSSCMYESDIRHSRSLSIPRTIALLLVKRADRLAAKLKESPSSSSSSSPPSFDIEDAKLNEFCTANARAPDRDAMKLGNNPLIENVFIV